MTNVTEATVRGNRFHFFIGDWTVCQSGPRLYSAYTRNCFSCDLQKGSKNKSSEGFIAVAQPIESSESYTVKEGYVCEDFVNITEE